MNYQPRQRNLSLITLIFLVVLLLACRSITVVVDNSSPATKPVSPTQRIGFDFSGQVPFSPKGDSSARRHLFLHEYPILSDGFVTGVIYLNDSDKVAETFDLLILRPNDDGWTVIFRINLSDDTPPAQTGITTVDLPYPVPVQRNDIFGHWQYNASGAIPLNVDDKSLDGFSVGQYGFQSSEVEVGQQIDLNGFNGQRDYFINVVFSINP